MMVNIPPARSEGKNATNIAKGQFAPGAVYMVPSSSTTTPPVTRKNTAMNEDHAPTSRTSPVASLTKTVGFPDANDKACKIVTSTFIYS
jgi:hypothetical protein